MTIKSFDDAQLEEICRVLADTYEGLTGSEIGRFLSRLGIPDPDPALTKWKRLFNALGTKQNNDHCGNHIVAFIQEVMKPVRYRNNPSGFEDKRAQLNTVLAFCGYYLNEKGQVILRDAVSTLSEAQKRAGKLRHDLLQRNVHADVLFFLS